MSSISFRAEVTGKVHTTYHARAVGKLLYDTVPFTKQASNDDHILQSCLNLHSKVDKQKANQTGK